LLGPLFLYALSQTPPVAYTIYGCIGLGMGLPYLVIGAFPGLVRWLPKPGEWMETVKEVMGFVLLATVVYLFWAINPSYFVPTLGLLVAVWFGLWMVGRVPLYESTSKQLFAWARGIAAAAVLGWTAFALFGPASAAQKAEGLAWQPYSEPALQALQREGKTVMLDFTANWCLTCQYNTKFAIDTPKVKELVAKNGVVPMVADWTDQNAEIKAKLDELASRSIPLLAIYPAGRPGEVILLRDALVESQVLEALEKAGPSQSALTAGSPAATKATAETAAPLPPSG
jgi:thiol:disulfide interchange protein